MLVIPIGIYIDIFFGRRAVTETTRSALSGRIKIFDKIHKPKRSLQSAKYLRNFFSRKFENILNYEPDHLSNRFYRRMEFCLAEVILFNLYLIEYDINIQKPII